MENKINIAELLKDCPKGMELDCSICNGIKFIELDRSPNFPIVVRANNGYEFSLTKYGKVYNIDDAKCVIFPKGKTTWEGFTRPFKDGDVIYTESFIAIFSHITEDGEVCYHCYYYINTKKFKAKRDFGIGNINYDEFRIATADEKAKLFQVIKDNGYKWNAETKTLEKLPKFKVGNRIKKKDSNEDDVLITDIVDNYYIVETKYGMGVTISINIQNNYELVPNKFDITTLKPFNKVLIRDRDTDEWNCNLFSYYRKNSDRPYVCIGYDGMNEYEQCIPYGENEHLLGKTDDCDEYFKTWE